jgi:hypothetical protein
MICAALFLRAWAGRDPEIRWPCVGLILIALLLMGAL